MSKAACAHVDDGQQERTRFSPPRLALPWLGPCSCVQHIAGGTPVALTSDGECAGGALGGCACIAGHHPQLVLSDAFAVQLCRGDDHAAAAIDKEVHAGHAHLHAVGHQPIQALVQVDSHHLSERRGCVSSDTRTDTSQYSRPPH